jgi:hypothetical protein
LGWETPVAYVGGSAGGGFTAGWNADANPPNAGGATLCVIGFGPNGSPR